MKNWRRVTSASFLTALVAIGNVVPSMAATTDNSINKNKKENAALAREVASEGMVLLKNDETPENFQSTYEEYQKAYETRKAIIENLYHEIKIIKKLKV